MASGYAFKGGYPTAGTVKKAYDDADFGPEAPAFDGSWKPGDFEKVK